MYRKIYETLTDWEEKKIKEPLLIIGARQIGKTYIIKEFCESTYGHSLYVNFESNPEYEAVFDDGLEPIRIIRQLEILLGDKIPADTAIFFDEIQKCEKAITALKYFCEAKENYRIIGAGSLLGVKLNRFEGSFPVGKVKIEYMYPMDFEEFLTAIGEELLRDEIRASYKTLKPLTEAIHNKAIKLYHDYIFVGGMPQSINDYINKGRDISDFDREIQRNILLAYLADMSKYTVSAAESVKITEVFNSVPRQLSHENPKFRYNEVRGNANKRDFYPALDWLVSSGMVYKICKAEAPHTPLKAYEDNDNFKLYFSDVGLLSEMSGLQYKSILSGEHNIYKGAVTENYVIQTLRGKKRNLCYYKPNAGMEIDLLLDEDGEIIPIEIKSGRHKRSTSLKNYNEKYAPQKMLRISELNFGRADNLYSIPLYAAFCI